MSESARSPLFTWRASQRVRESGFAIARAAAVYSMTSQQRPNRRGRALVDDDQSRSTGGQRCPRV